MDVITTEGMSAGISSFHFRRWCRWIFDRFCVVQFDSELTPDEEQLLKILKLSCQFPRGLVPAEKKVLIVQRHRQRADHAGISSSSERRG